MYLEDIQTRLKVLEMRLYDSDEPIIDEEAEAEIQAKEAEMLLVRPHAFYGANTRSGGGLQARIGVDGHFGYDLGFEYALRRQISAFANLHNRIRQSEGLPLNFEVGGKFAVLKSANRGLLLSVGLSLRVGFDQGTGFRSGGMLFAAFGWLPSEVGQLQVLFGAEMPFTPASTLAYRGGLHGSFRLSELLGLAVETSVRARPRAHDGTFGTYPGQRSNAFVFAEGSVGLLIFPWKDNMEVRIGATVPYVTSYWRDYNPLGIDLGLQVYLPPKPSK
jgi:hypothetical protein